MADAVDMARRADHAHDALVIQAVGVAATLVSIVFGILSIGRSLL